MMILLGSAELRTPCTPYQTHSAILAFFDGGVNSFSLTEKRVLIALYHEISSQDNKFSLIDFITNSTKILNI